MSRLRAVSALAFVVTLSACATATRVSAPPLVPDQPQRQASFEEVLAAYDDYCRANHSFSGTGDLAVADYRAGKERRVGVRVVAVEGGRLYLKASVAVVTALEVVSDGEEFWFSLPSKKTVWTGPAMSRRTSGEITDADAPYKALRPRDITLALLPEPFAPLGEGESLVFEAQAGSFGLTLARSEGARSVARRRVWLERESLRLARMWTYDERGELDSETRFGDWNGGAPRRITILRPLDGYQAAFVLDKVETNVEIPERAFVPRLPEGHEVKRVED